MDNAYTVIAGYYDKLMTDFDYNGYFRFVKDYIKGDVLELACGSGTFTKMIVNVANTVVAVDNCSDMLNLAMQNNFKDRKYITFVNDSMLEFKPMKSMDTAVCVCDGVNYISKDELIILFKNVYNTIKINSYFIFDISSSYKLREVIGNNVFYEDDDDYTYLWTNECNDDKITMDIAMFSRKGDVYSRQDECHTQHIHDHSRLVDLLCEQGFSVNVFDGEDYSDVRDNSRRLLFVCQKR